MRTIKVTKCGSEEEYNQEDILNLLGWHSDEAYRIKSWWISQDEAEVYYNSQADYYLYVKIESA